MKNSFEFIFSLFALLLSFIIVHAAYVGLIRPKAEAFMNEQDAMMEVNPDYVPERSIFVVIQDFEQEACFILMFWALAILGFKYWDANNQKKLLELDFIGLPEDTPVTPAISPKIIKNIETIPPRQQEFLLPRLLTGSLGRFVSTKNVQDAATEINSLCDQESDRLDSEMSIIRYIAWAIPSFGFIGTVRGIGEALSQAHRAVEGDITGVTRHLGVAFNSTFIALAISIVLMFIIHQVQLYQDRLVHKSGQYCSERLINRLSP
ncbi:MAG: MotA/TolQ/ExbB proton channel family protein [Puniceicoccaceae bacterium]